MRTSQLDLCSTSLIELSADEARMVDGGLWGVCNAVGTFVTTIVAPIVGIFNPGAGAIVAVSGAVVNAIGDWTNRWFPR